MMTHAFTFERTFTRSIRVARTLSSVDEVWVERGGCLHRVAPADALQHGEDGRVVADARPAPLLPANARAIAAPSLNFDPSSCRAASYSRTCGSAKCTSSIRPSRHVPAAYTPYSVQSKPLQRAEEVRVPSFAVVRDAFQTRHRRPRRARR